MSRATLWAQSRLVSWCFEPSQLQRVTLHQGWQQTSVYLHVIHPTSLYTTSLFFSNRNSNSIHNFGTQTQKNKTHVLKPIYIPRALNTGTCIQQGDLFYSEGLHRNPRPQSSQIAKPLWIDPCLKSGRTNLNLKKKKKRNRMRGLNGPTFFQKSSQAWKKPPPQPPPPPPHRNRC